MDEIVKDQLKKLVFTTEEERTDINDDLSGLNYSDIISDFLNLITQAKKDVAIGTERVIDCNRIINDAEHFLELNDLSHHEHARLNKFITKMKRERRIYKDAVELGQPIIEFLDDTTNTRCFNNLGQLLGSIRKIEKYHINRSYHNKTNVNFYDIIGRRKDEDEPDNE